MFGSLFELEDDSDEKYDTQTSLKKKKFVSTAPPLPRGKTNFCGLQNQGATCYLNSLIQTLFHTPEFRESLLKFGSNELGNYLEQENIKARVIPFQLQRLFTQLLLLNQESVSTADLTESFGWNGSEASEQHDIQELNRILFSAIETSLAGTSGEDIIRQFYRGTFVTKVVCQQCENISEREEVFLDLPVTLMRCSSLEESLQLLFIGVETLEGGNQYRCETCGNLVNAIKSAKLRNLPSILTFNLLRFSYDFHKGERFKETKRYTFPLLLNMGAFCDSETTDNTVYELYSVVIHSGSCYGGHYHAYIKDLEGLGVWSEPEKDVVKLVYNGSPGHETVVSCSDPINLLRKLLIQLGGTTSLDQLCQSLTKQTGWSWNKRFKSQYGPLPKFFRKHQDIFTFGNGWVSLTGANQDGEEKWITVGQKSSQESSRKLENTAVNTRPQNGGNCSGKNEHNGKNGNLHDTRGSWFDFNDARVSCIREKDIQSQFAGRESAYVLFYRKKSLNHYSKAKLVADRLKCLIPLPLSVEAEILNQDLEKKRMDYDMAQNQISLTVHFSENYTVKDGALVLNECAPTDPAFITLDKRQNVRELANTVKNLGHQRPEALVMHIARDLPAGLHLYHEIQVEANKLLMASGVCDGTKIFVWNGKEVDKHSVHPGQEHEPLLLSIAFCMNSVADDKIELQKAFPKSCTIGEVKIIAADLIGIDLQQLVFSVIRRKGRTKLVAEELGFTKDSLTLSELQFCDGECITTERRNQENVHPVLTSLEVERQNNTVDLVVEDRSLELVENTLNQWPVFHLAARKNQLICDFKEQILRERCVSWSVDECCLRITNDDDVLGLGPPLYEHLSVSDAGLKKGQKLVLERGTSPREGEVAIRFRLLSKASTEDKLIILNKNSTIQECLKKILLLMNDITAGTEWHLRKTNWFGEPGQLLCDQNDTLEDNCISNGDTLLLEEGKLLPKGFLQLSLWSCRSAFQTANEQGVLSWITSGIQGLLGTLTIQETNKNNCDLKVADELQHLGELEINEDATLDDLKEQICSLPLLCKMAIPTPGFLRIQELVDGFPKRVFRNTERSLRQLKISSSTKLFVKILQYEENLSQSTILLNVATRIAETRNYEPNFEVVFYARDGATPSSLNQCLADTSGILPDRLRMAKYIRDKHLWLPIKMKATTQNKKKVSKMKINLRHAPVYLQDGDVIGIKDITKDPAGEDDFSTQADDEARERLKNQNEKKKDRRKNNKKHRTNRPEKQLKIHVDDFR